MLKLIPPVVSLLLLIRVGRLSVHPRALFFATFLFVFVLTNCVGLLFPRDSLADTAGYDIDDDWLALAGFCYMPFILLGHHLIKWLSQGPIIATQKAPVLNPIGIAMCCSILFISSAVIVRYMAIDGITKIGAWSEIVDFHSAYKTRYSFENVEGVGSFSSSVAAFVVIPMVGMLFLLMARDVPITTRFLVVCVPMMLTVARSLTNLQRGAVTIQLLVMIIGMSAIAFQFDARRLGVSLKRLAFFLALASAVFTTAGYFAFAKFSTGGNPITRLYERLVTIPSHTASLYFGFFPSPLPFRGLSGVIGMPVGSATEYMNEPTSIKTVGELANGWAHNANANFMATGYSAAGVLGIAVVSAIMLVFLLLNSMFCGRLGFQFSVVYTVANLNGFFALVQSDIGSALAIGYPLGNVIAFAIVRFGVKPQGPLS